MSFISPIAFLASTGSTSGVDVTPLADRFNTDLAGRLHWADREKMGILAQANNPDTAADPQALHALQLRQEAYTKQIALASALMSHATKGVETLVKS